MDSTIKQKIIKTHLDKRAKQARRIAYAKHQLKTKYVQA